MIVDYLKENPTTQTETQIIHFPYGLLGFEQYKDFYIIKNENNDLFLFLQATTNSKIFFILTQGEFFFPEMVKKEYLYLQKNEKFFHIMTISEDKKEKKFSLNFLGPLIIDTKKYEGRQIISKNRNHQTKHFIEKEEIQKLKAEKINITQCFEKNLLTTLSGKN